MNGRPMGVAVDHGVHLRMVQGRTHRLRIHIHNRCRRALRVQFATRPNAGRKPFAAT